jgi:urease accessory protein UreH
MQVNFQEKGRAVLEVECIFKESTVISAYATSPMKLLTPRSRGRCVCGYVCNLGGGMVAGDQTRLELRVGNQARCFLGTQASTKVYRNPHSLPCSHVTYATIGVDALLVFAPAPVQPFAHSSYQQRQEFRLARGGGLALVDWFTSGRAACGEQWAFEHLSMRNEVWQSAEPCGAAEASASSTGSVSISDKCVFLDCCSLDSKDGNLASAHRSGRFNCFAILVLIGAPLKKQAERILEEVRWLSVKRRGSLLMTASPVQNGAVLRVAGEQVREVDSCLRKHLESLAGELGEDPWSRRC